MSSWRSQFVGRGVLGVSVNDFAVAVVGFVFDSVGVDCAQPHVVALGVGIEDVDGDVWMAHFGYYGPVCSIADIDRSVLFRGVAD
jgi:hypothetical protein